MKGYAINEVDSLAVELVTKNMLKDVSNYITNSTHKCATNSLIYQHEVTVLWLMELISKETWEEITEQLFKIK